jgi:hypothetical protein
MELFSITCTTCQARLKVRELSAIGEILACPKCQSMVQVLPPAGWRPPARPPAPRTPEEQAAIASLPETIDDSQIEPPTTRNRPAIRAVRGFRNDVDQPQDAVSDATQPPKPRDDAASDASTASATLPGAAVSDTERRWRKRMILIAVPATAALVALAIWSGRRNDPPQPHPQPAQESTADRDASAPAAVAPPVSVAQPPAPFPRRWLPHDAQLILALHPAELSRDPALEAVLARTGSLWQQLLYPLQKTLRLPPETIRRLTWACTDLADLSQRSLVVIELAQPLEDDAAVLSGSEKLEFRLDDAVCHRFADAAWKHPLAVIDDRTIVTGPRELLAPLSSVPEAPPPPTPLDRALDAADPALPVTIGLDLSALRALEVALPAWLAALPALGEAWKTVHRLPLAMVVGLHIASLEASSNTAKQNSSGMRADVHLICGDDSTALALHAALKTFGDTASKSLVTRDELIAQQLQAGEITVEAASQRKLLLDQAAAALSARESGVEGRQVWLRTHWSGSAALLASTAISAVPAWEAQRLSAARVADEGNYRKLLDGLAGYEKAEGKLPAGAAGVPLVPADHRLSWFASMLPYYGHLDWHGELNFTRSWNDPANLPITQRPLDLLVNPALTPGTTRDGFPVTHYVGLAGLGAGAAELPADDPRAGLFGFSRRVARESHGDGASHTIAILGVSGKLGPWAAGGDSTVRALTKEPYINGPDGFGSGQPDGMLAGMADGSVRFLSDKMSPRILEQLATLRGPKPAHIAGFDPPKVAAAEGPKPPDEQPARPMPEPAAKPQAEVKPAVEAPKKPSIDIVARLSQKIPSAELRNVRLADLAQFAAMIAAVPVVLDENGLAEAGITGDRTVSVSLADCTIAELLERALADAGLVYVIESDQIKVTTRARQLRPKQP